MRDLLAAELQKIRAGRVWWGLLVGGFALCILTSYGYVVDGRNSLPRNGSPATITSDVVRSFMMMFLFTGVLGAIVVSREYGSRTIIRTTLLTGSKGRVFVAKTVATALTGAGFGLVAVIGAIAVPFLVMPPLGVTPTWSADATWTVVGVFACTVLAGLWGGFLGWIVRSPIGAVSAVIGLTLLIDPAVQRLVPSVAKFFFTIALSAVYRDPKPDLLAPWSALVVVALWLVAVGFVGRRLFAARDVG